MTATPSLYRQVMGPEFDSLPHELQLFHGSAGLTRLAGRCTVQGPSTMLGKLLGYLFALPRTTGESRLLFELEADTRQETWRRHFPNRLMISRMRVMKGALVERFGPVTLHFSLKAENGKLVMLLNGISMAGVPCPRFLVPSVIAEETASPGKLHFNVAARLPVVGLLVAYQGFLQVVSDKEAA